MDEEGNVATSDESGNIIYVHIDDYYVIDKFIHHQGNTNILQLAIYDVGEHQKHKKTLSQFLDENHSEGRSLTYLLFNVLVDNKRDYVNNFQAAVVSEVEKDPSNAFERLAGVIMRNSRKLGDQLMAALGPDRNDVIVTIVEARDGSSVRINPDDFKNGKRTPDTPE